jgi:hypothetical protein
MRDDEWKDFTKKISLATAPLPRISSNRKSDLNPLPLVQSGLPLKENHTLKSPEESIPFPVRLI